MQKFSFRIVPWWTDQCSTFLSNIFKWLPKVVGASLTVLEFGSGNSTLYLLSRGAKVATIEGHDDYINFIVGMAERAGYTAAVVKAVDFTERDFDKYDLIAIKANELSETDGVIAKMDWSIIINDGISRKDVLSEIQNTDKNSIVVLDNCEYCANWGRLDRSSAKPDLIQVYRAFLRDPKWRHSIFEQPEGRDGHGTADKTGWESPHRWASAVCWPQDHLLAKMMVTSLGLPLVNEQGLEDRDLSTIGERCPFDWNTMTWLKEPFPETLDLKLDRSYD